MHVGAWTSLLEIFKIKIVGFVVIIKQFILMNYQCPLIFEKYQRDRNILLVKKKKKKQPLLAFHAKLLLNWMVLEPLYILQSCGDAT